MLITWWSILHPREGHSVITSRITEAHKKPTWGQIKGEQALHSWSLLTTLLVNHSYKTPHQVPQSWDTQVLRARSHCPPWPSKAIKLCFFFFTQNSASQIRLGICAEAIFSIIMFIINQYSHAAHWGQHHTLTKSSLKIKNGEGPGGLENKAGPRIHAKDFGNYIDDNKKPWRNLSKWGTGSHLDGRKITL